MKKLGLLLVTLFALGLFAISAFALTDTFSFTVTIPALNYFLITDGADSINVDATDLTAGYKNVTSATDIAIYDNGTWTATVGLDKDPSGYLLWCDDDDTGQNTANWTALTLAGGVAMSSFTGYGTAGQQRLHQHPSADHRSGLDGQGRNWNHLHGDGYVHAEHI